MNFIFGLFLGLIGGGAAAVLALALLLIGTRNEAAMVAQLSDDT